MKNYGNIQQKAFITSNVEKRWLMGALWKHIYMHAVK
jgi:hypothetical protein